MGRFITGVAGGVRSSRSTRGVCLRLALQGRVVLVRTVVVDGRWLWGLFFVEDFPLWAVASLVVGVLALFGPRGIFRGTGPVGGCGVFISTVGLGGAIAFGRGEL